MPATARPTQAHSNAAGQADAKPKLYNPRHPERTLLYQTIAEHFETWFELASAGQFDGQGDHHTPKLCSSLNAHVHFHVRVVDGVFEEVAGIVFHPASAIDETAVAQVQTDLRRRILRAFVGRGRC